MPVKPLHSPTYQLTACHDNCTFGLLQGVKSEKRAILDDQKLMWLLAGWWLLQVANA
jgi:hypothetical protein